MVGILFLPSPTVTVIHRKINTSRSLDVESIGRMDGQKCAIIIEKNSFYGSVMKEKKCVPLCFTPKVFDTTILFAQSKSSVLNSLPLASDFSFSG